MHTHFFYFFIYFLFFLGWAQLNPCGWARPSRPSRVTGPSQWPGWPAGGTCNACVHSEWLIKFKLHSDFVMKNGRGGNEKLTWSTNVAGGERRGITVALEDSLLFLFIFYLLSPLVSSVMCFLVLLSYVCSFCFVPIFSGSYVFLCFFEK